MKVKKLEPDAARPFVLALGKKSHGLVIAKTPSLSAGHKKRARAMREGSGKVFIGLVYGEGGKHVFQLEESLRRTRQGDQEDGEDAHRPVDPRDPPRSRRVRA